MGGKKKSTTTSSYRPPSWVEGAARQAVGIGQRIGSQQYGAYEGERVAPLSRNEQRGIRMAQDTGVGGEHFDESARLAKSGTASWIDADQEAYMNPFIKGALDPAAREIREEGARTAEQLKGQQASIGAFGGSRGALLESENREQTLQQVSDLYGRGFALAYENAQNIWGDERARDMQASGRLQELGTAVQNAHSEDISTLMATGATDRGLQQAMRDFDYQQFIEERDWDFRNLGGLVASLEGTRGSYSTTTVNRTEAQSGNGVMQAIGIAAAIIGAFFTGGATLAAIPAIAGME